MLPLIVTLAGSLREPGRPPPRTPELVPWPPTVEGYRQAMELIDLGRVSANSIVVALLAVALTLIVASSGGFALARLPLRPARWVVGASLVALMVPLTALLVGRFTIFSGLRLTDSFAPLVAPGLIATSPLYLLVFYWSFRRLPAELFEAARLEGATPIVTWWRVGMPQVWPVTVAVGSLAFVISWGDFLGPLIYLFDARLYTMPLGMRALAQLDPTRAPLLLAAAVIATAPVVVAFLIGQRALAREVDEL